MINKIKCFFGFHEFTNWVFLGYVRIHGETINKRFCIRCQHTETLRLRRDK